MQRLSPTKKKGKAVNVFVFATGLSLCTEQRVDFALEMGGLELTHKGVSFTKQISFPVSVCDAMT